MAKSAATQNPSPQNPAGPEPAATLRLNSPVTDLPGIGPRKASRLANLNIQTIADLIRHLPMRYQRESAEQPIGELIPHQAGLLMDAKPDSANDVSNASSFDTKLVRTCVGTVMACNWSGPAYSKKGRFTATLEDDTGTLQLVWFNASYLRDRLHPGDTIAVQGKVKLFQGYPQMASPRWWYVDDEGNRTETAEDADTVNSNAATSDEREPDTLRPIYPATEDLKSWAIEKLIEEALPQVLPRMIDPLPEELLKHHNMPPLAEAYRQIHRPKDDDEAKAARRRLAFNELLLLQLGIALKRAYVEQQLDAFSLPSSDAIDQHITDRFPFPLTNAQRKVIGELREDLKQTHPMNRLLQGDVGAGKTVVALYAMLLAVADRKQAAIMAPTELLAEQHYKSITQFLTNSNVRTTLLTGLKPGQAIGRDSNQQSNDDKRRALAAGEIDLVVGTHALLSDSTQFKNLAVIVIDEQHRFGVEQRAAFRETNHDSANPDAKPVVPHHLLMTATPIPRTLSLTVFGDLDVSTITGLPPGRVPVANRVVHPSQADDVYEYIANKRLPRGEQVYVVVPTIDENNNDLVNLNEHVVELREKYFADYVVEAVHGRMKPDEREAIMQRFRQGDVHVLVATTVIEVGVDVPNASVMVIEHAERFGLAQLHQLRGRVGRSTDHRRGLCVFIANPTTEDGEARLAAIASTNDGFKIAEKDLEIRGLGDFFGTRQSGNPPLRLARIPEDLDLLQLAKRDAQHLIQSDPTLSKPKHTRLRQILLQQYGQTLNLIDVG